MTTCRRTPNRVVALEDARRPDEEAALHRRRVDARWRGRLFLGKAARVPAGSGRSRCRLMGARYRLCATVRVLLLGPRPRALGQASGTHHVGGRDHRQPWRSRASPTRRPGWVDLGQRTRPGAACIPGNAGSLLALELRRQAGVLACAPRPLRRRQPSVGLIASGPQSSRGPAGLPVSKTVARVPRGLSDESTTHALRVRVGHDLRRGRAHRLDGSQPRQRRVPPGRALDAGWEGTSCSAMNSRMSARAKLSDRRVVARGPTAFWRKSFGGSAPTRRQCVG